MRIGYSDDESFPGQFDIWQANCHRSLKGRKGQAALRELEAALLALPKPRLIRQSVSCDGEVCAVGALMLALKVRRGTSREDALRELEALNDDYTDAAAEREGIPRLVAWKLVELNDIELDGRFDRDLHRFIEITPEERYERVLTWVRSQLAEPPS